MSVIHVIEFDGVGDYVEVPYDEAHNPAAFTSCFWARVTGANSQGRTALSTRQEYNGYSFNLGADNVWEYRIGTGTTWNIVRGARLRGPRISVSSTRHMCIYIPGQEAYALYPTHWIRLIGDVSRISANHDGTLQNAGGMASGGVLYVNKVVPNAALWRGETGEPDGVTVVSGASRSHYWVLTSGGAVHQYANGTWKHFGDDILLKDISVAYDGMVCGIDLNNKVLRYLGDDEWEELPGTMVRVAAGSADYIWALDSARNVYYLTGEGQWKQVEGNLTWIDVGFDGEVWGCNGSIVYWYTREAIPITLAVKAYTGPLFTSESFSIPVGDHVGDGLAALLDGREIKSLYVPPGLEVAVFTSSDLIGEHVVMQSWQDSDAALSALSGPIAGIQVRSIELPREPAEHVTLYSESNYWGKKYQITELGDCRQSDAHR